jgi:hypothetical protein
MRYILFLLLIWNQIRSQTTPQFGNDVLVTINGYTLDAMEPHLSPDGNAMFFNSVNNGTNTSLYYAGKVNDSTFNLVGLVPAVNEFTPPYLNAVASVDTANNFYWVSLRGYPANMDNLFKVTFTPTAAINFARVHGNIYVYSPGYILMDAAITRDGNQLYYCNAWFNSCAGGLPCSSRIGIGQKVNDSTFNSIPSSNTIMALVNDTNYIVYAPELSKDGLELYFTRALVNTFQSEVCVSVRTSTLSAFSTPTVLIGMPSIAPEGPTLNSSKSLLYYHKLSGGQYKLFLRKRIFTTGINESYSGNEIKVFPNPSNGTVIISSNMKGTLFLTDQLGRELKKITLSEKNGFSEVLSDLENGVYFLNDGNSCKKLIVMK